jgi:hypothetical protein
MYGDVFQTSHNTRSSRLFYFTTRSLELYVWQSIEPIRVADSDVVGWWDCNFEYMSKCAGDNSVTVT